MAQALRQPAGVDAAGSLSRSTLPLEAYAATIIGRLSTRVSFQREQIGYQQALTTGLAFERSNASGVNLDEEIANLILHQQTYAASARVISTVNEMLAVLVNLGK